MQFDLEVIGVSHLDASMRRWEEKVLEAELVIFPAVVKDFHLMEEKRFTRQGPGWEPLSDQRVREKTRKGTIGNGILVDEGDLVASLIRDDHPDSVTRVEPDSVFVGTRDPKAAYHQQGVPKRNLPARPVVEMSVEDKLRWIRIIARLISPSRAAVSSSSLVDVT